MQPFRLNQVRLLQSPFLQAEKVNLDYMLRLQPDRLLAPFLREAGLHPKAESYGNWENSGLDGHTAGHYLTALAQMYAATGNLECKRRLDYMTNELARCQANNPDGYVGGVPGGRQMWAKVKLGDFSEFDKKWVPWYNLHKLYAGLRDSYLLAENTQAKAVFLKLTDWAMDELSGLNEAQIQRMLGTEHGGMNEVCADAAAISGQRKYMDLARKFSHQALLMPLEKKEDKLSGMHANTQIPKVVGFERIAELSNDANYHSAAQFFWQTVVSKRTISIGGNSVREHFNPTGNFTSMIESEQGPETCNSNNMLKLSKMLFLHDVQAQYIEFYERLLYNHILSSQHPTKGGYVYFTPIHPQHYRVYSTPDEGFWCCVGTGMENHGKYGELIYTYRNRDLYVNLFIPSVLNWAERKLQLTQQNNFPERESSQLTVKIAKPESFTIYLRKPKWLDSEGYSVKVNGQTINLSSPVDNYIAIKRLWKTGDRISVQLPMKVYTEYLPDESHWISFLRGPVVLAAATDTSNLTGLRANGSRWGHIATGPMYPLTASPLLVGNQHDIEKALVKSKEGTNVYTVGNVVAQEKFKHLKLVPFYTLHDARYMLYWPVVSSKDSVLQKEAELQMLDNTYIKLASRTIDGVVPGEQQPENDHVLIKDKSETGVFRNLHWRNATGYFGYRLRMTPAVNKLSITYYGLESAEFDIYLNDIKLEHVTLAGTEGDAFVTKEFAVPEDVKKAGNSVQVKFVATPGKKTAAIYDLRLLK
ncbi:glycoside hydrolase family 127 protein [Mucilaginibacter lacusdianchii]|uniref:glycoside hydrolase family 127 protein n=1 Tax=Mucilaginibacter lacusdianchii TaxID=2684211 RepID=UPI001E58F9DB|nr:glycoside hydrolase family 127 protein [Mucilaginibacter sp. JXJ CY 39]